MTYKQGELVKHPKLEEWGLGEVLEDSNGKTIRVAFTNAGIKVLSLQHVQLNKVKKEVSNTPVSNPKKPTASTFGNSSSIQSEVINLQELYHYIKGHKNIPHRSNDSNTYKPFKALIEKSIARVPKKTGWYCWVDNSLNRAPIYIGKSDGNTTYNLYKRIEEELAEEYVALWATVYNELEMLEEFNRKYNYKYINNNLRAVKKKGVSHIFWVSTNERIDKHEIGAIETKLIQHFSPLANQQKKNPPPYESPLYESVLERFSILLQTIYNKSS